MRNERLHEKREFENVRALVEFAAEQYGEKIAYSFRPTPRAEIEKYTFSQMRDQVRALASEMSAMGCAGQHCALIGKFSYEWVLYTIGIFGL